MSTFTQMIEQGYRIGAPSLEAEDIDAGVVERMRCRKCGGSMRYEGYHRHNEYVALAVCNQCKHWVYL